MKLFRRKTEEEAVRQEIAVKEAAPFEGLTEAEAAARAAAGWDNRPVDSPTKSDRQIIRENLLTYFNLIFIVLAAALIVWKLTVGRRRYRYGRSVPRRRGGGYRGRRRH